MQQGQVPRWLLEGTYPEIRSGSREFPLPLAEVLGAVTGWPAPSERSLCWAEQSYHLDAGMGSSEPWASVLSPQGRRYYVENLSGEVADFGARLTGLLGPAPGSRDRTEALCRRWLGQWADGLMSSSVPLHPVAEVAVAARVMAACRPAPVPEALVPFLMGRHLVSDPSFGACCPVMTPALESAGRVAAWNRLKPADWMDWVHVCAKDWQRSLRVTRTRYDGWRDAEAKAAGFLAGEMKPDAVRGLVVALASIGFERGRDSITVGDLADRAGVTFATAGKAIDRWVTAGVLSSATPANQQRNRAWVLASDWRNRFSGMEASVVAAAHAMKPAMPPLPKVGSAGQSKATKR